LLPTGSVVTSSPFTNSFHPPIHASPKHLSNTSSHHSHHYNLSKLTLPSDEPLLLLTKGDNNAADDTELYARGQKYLDRDRDVIGSVVGFVPYVGYGTILLSEYPWLKTAMLGLMGLTVVLQRE